MFKVHKSLLIPQQITHDVTKYSMTRHEIFCHIIYYFHMVDEYIRNILWCDMKYFKRFLHNREFLSIGVWKNCILPTGNFCSIKTTGSHPCSVHSTCLLGLFCFACTWTCFVHFTSFNSIKEFSSLAHSSTLIEMMDTTPLHRSFHWLTPHSSILACSGCGVDLCRTGSFLYKYLHTYIS
jgi:hypothetical protein